MQLYNYRVNSKIFLIVFTVKFRVNYENGQNEPEPAFSIY